VVSWSLWWTVPLLFILSGPDDRSHLDGNKLAPPPVLVDHRKLEAVPVGIRVNRARGIQKKKLMNKNLRVRG
jgi:hypothetical protein